MISAIFSFLIVGPIRAKAASNSRTDWVGEYILRQSSETSDEVWSSILAISDCSEKACKYSFSSGSMQSECSSEGTLSFKSAKRAEDTVEVKPESDDAARGKCVLSFEKRANGKIYVDAKDVFASKKEEELGAPCNSLCGAQGARYFGVELPKVSDTRFSNPSFSCLTEKLSKIEKQICVSEDLAKKDRDLSDRVAKIKRDQPKLVAKLTTDQRTWMKEREVKCADSRAIETCLDEIYDSRLKALSLY